MPHTKEYTFKYKNHLFYNDMKISAVRDIYQLRVMHTIGNSHMISIESFKVARMREWRAATQQHMHTNRNTNNQ